MRLFQTAILRAEEGRSPPPPATATVITPLKFKPPACCHGDEDEPERGGAAGPPGAAVNTINNSARKQIASNRERERERETERKWANTVNTVEASFRAKVAGLRGETIPRFHLLGVMGSTSRGGAIRDSSPSRWPQAFRLQATGGGPGRTDMKMKRVRSGLSCH